METITLKGRSITSGVAEGEALVSNQTFGFSHCIEPDTGRVSDRMHEWMGQNVKGKVLVFPYAKGSTTNGIFFLETLRLGNAPLAIINLEVEPVIAAGFILANVLFKKEVPVVDHLEQNPIELLEAGDWVRVDANSGTVQIQKKSRVPK